VSEIRVLGFAAAREALGRPTLRRSIPAEGIELDLLLRELTAEHPQLGRILPHARFVRNGEYVRGRGVRVLPGDEIAIHPPYSGG
jgi:molybdopterin converting factor small subunit